jgi:hypothetical protein
VTRLPAGITVNPSTNTESVTVVWNVVPWRADAELSAVSVRTVKTVPSGRITRSWASARSWKRIVEAKLAAINQIEDDRDPRIFLTS